MTRMVIADDHAIVREGLKRIARRAADLEVGPRRPTATQVMRLVRERNSTCWCWTCRCPGEAAWN